MLLMRKIHKDDVVRCQINLFAAFSYCEASISFQPNLKQGNMPGNFYRSSLQKIKLSVCRVNLVRTISFVVTSMVLPINPYYFPET